MIHSTGGILKKLLSEIEPDELDKVKENMKPTMKVLDLPLKKEWYDMIESGNKPEEYREIKPYWSKRICGCIFTTKSMCKKDKCTYCKDITHIRFRYGYTKRTMLFELKSIKIGIGNPEWGAPKEKVFILKLGEKIND